MKIALGIDTGGTFTDAVLVQHGTNRILALAKALTTKQDLSIGIREAIDRVLGDTRSDVHLVSLSTTLATNAIVEDKGSPVCVLLIGYEGRLDGRIDIGEALGTTRYVCMPGGHRANGKVWEPLDMEAAREAIQQHAPHVAALAVSGYFGTRNPSHELKVKGLAREMVDLPVTCGHELTHRLDALRRAATVALNARLIPLICEMIDAVEATLIEQGVDAPLMVVKGDGSLVRSAVARERPVETILSGPAASVVGARALSHGEDLVVVDMGGTTTDIAAIEGGQPRLSAQGARVGRWRTMVEAIDVHTAGLGGDSQVWFGRDGEIGVGPKRIVPLCFLAAQYPQVRGILEEGELQGPEQEGFFLLQRRDWDADDGQPPFVRRLRDALAEGPCSLVRVHRLMEYPRFHARHLRELERQGLVVQAGFTPTDAAHVLGHYGEWDAEASHMAAERLATYFDVDVRALCEDVLQRTSECIAIEITHKLLGDEGYEDNGDRSDMDSFLLDLALRSCEASNLRCQIMLHSQLVAIGAPVETYFPRVRDLLHGTLHIPDHAEVANALGAVAGSVVSRVHILIVPDEDAGLFRVHFPDGLRDYATLDEALACAETRGRVLALEEARRAGAEDVRVQVERRDQRAPVATGWGEELYLQTLLDVTAVGRPRLARRDG
ncbi:MAG: hydantoinase/oxoprolinase N-terminal domain-containing protein, partial [Anaerolineales bacterium]